MDNFILDVKNRDMRNGVSGKYDPALSREHK